MSDGAVAPFTVRMSDGNVVKLEYYPSLPSPTRLAREYARAGYPDRYVVLTEEKTSHQTGKGIYMALILRPSIFPSQAVFVTPSAAVATAQALKEHTLSDIGIGWVSSIFCDGAQIGSITVEGKLDNFTSYEYMIISFDIELSEKSFPPRLTDMVKRVFESENASISMIIAKNILNKFFPFYSTIKSPQRAMTVYNSLFSMRGERIKCTVDGTVSSCKVLGVDDASCALIVEGRGGQIEKVTTLTGVTLPKKLRRKKKKA